MIVVLTGPTGSGKSAMAISLAKKLGGAVVNADAFQVYRELNIATAKPSEEERMSVPHFLFDFIPLETDYSVAEYQEDLRSVIATLEKKGCPIFIAGGTGLYLRAGLYDYSFESGKKVDMTPYSSLGEKELHDALREIDPQSAASIHPRNRVRVLRAIEIYLSTGKTKSELDGQRKPAPLYPARFFGISAPRAPLYERVERRVDAMFEAGLVEENRRLVEKYGRAPHAFQAIGVKELFPYFDGEKSLEECKDDIKKATRHYIKRQETFFRHQFDIEWIESEEDILEALKNECEITEAR